MKEILQQYAAYNCWSNQRMSDFIQPLEMGLLEKEIPSSFSSIHSTLLHMWDAESIWWQRMKLQEVITSPSANFKGNAKDVVAALLHQNKLWESWVNNATESAINHVFHYRNSKKEQFKQPVYQVLLHVFNHATYHRGQLVNMFRQVGLDKIPGTDFILWSRAKK
ncbi:MAG TPA: DinB family protein [Flavitalea sp.]|nr:DinB family protein [Flavitalea sp.]